MVDYIFRGDRGVRDMNNKKDFKEALVRRLSRLNIEGKAGVDKVSIMEWRCDEGEMGGGPVSLWDQLRYGYGINNETALSFILECLLMELNVIQIGSPSSTKALSWFQGKYSGGGGEGEILEMLRSERISISEADSKLHEI